MVGPRHRGGYGRPFRRPGATSGTVPAGTDERALSALYGEHAASVRAFVRTFTSDAGQVEDVVQETFLRVWRHIDGVRAGVNPRSYLFTTARNVLTDQWRARQRRPDLVNDDLRLAREPAQDAVDTALQTLKVNEALRR